MEKELEVEEFDDALEKELIEKENEATENMHVDSFMQKWWLVICLIAVIVFCICILLYFIFVQ